VRAREVDAKRMQPQRRRGTEKRRVGRMGRVGHMGPMGRMEFVGWSGSVRCESLAPAGREGTDVAYPEFEDSLGARVARPVGAKMSSEGGEEERASAEDSGSTAREERRGVRGWKPRTPRGKRKRRAKRRHTRGSCGRRIKQPRVVELGHCRTRRGRLLRRAIDTLSQKTGRGRKRRHHARRLAWWHSPHEYQCPAPHSGHATSSGVPRRE
jgi:hypothetical protein